MLYTVYMLLQEDTKLVTHHCPLLFNTEFIIEWWLPCLPHIFNPTPNPTGYCMVIYAEIDGGYCPAIRRRADSVHIVLQRKCSDILGGVVLLSGNLVAKMEFTKSALSLRGPSTIR